MSKLIYITESQFQSLVEDGTYLQTGSTINPYRYGGAEVSASSVTGNDVDDDVELGKPVTTDKIGKSITNQGRYRGVYGPKAATRGMMESSTSKKKMIPESNQDFKNRDIQLSKTLRQELSNSGTEVGRNLAKKGRISFDYSYKLQNDLKNGNADPNLDPNGKLYKELDRKTETAEDISRNQREYKMKRGENIRNTSVNKNAFTASSHTPNGNNIIGVAYKDN